VAKLDWKPDADLVVALGAGGLAAVSPAPAPRWSCAGRHAKLWHHQAGSREIEIELVCAKGKPRGIAGRGEKNERFDIEPAQWDKTWKELDATDWRKARRCVQSESASDEDELTLEVGADKRTFSCRFADDPDGPLAEAIMMLLGCAP
jgi:hypothetical protein